jgi:8-oxo-dGTP pyrophosphatase MutT (NUDIX family)
MNRVQASGGVVVKRENNLLKIILIIFKDGSGLAIPKGKIEKGENQKSTAIREVQEETGLRGLKINKKLGIITRPSTEDNGVTLIKDIHVFLMDAKDYTHHKADENYGWFTIDAFVEEADFLKEVKDQIQRQ